jgi:glycosyltransferase involved in cell wall biosynthesis
VRPLLERARFVAVPSLCHEVAPLAAAEAMAAGRPLLATRMGGLPELVGRTRGLVCDSGDVVDMAEKIRRLMADDDLCRSAGQAASTFARDHLTPARHRMALEEAYAAVMASAGRPVKASPGDPR